MYEPPSVIRIGDIIIGSRRENISIDNIELNSIINKNNKYRNKGIGTLIMKKLLCKFEEQGIKKLYGIISRNDDFIKLENYWKKLGFTVIYNDKENTTHSNIEKIFQ